MIRGQCAEVDVRQAQETINSTSQPDRSSKQSSRLGLDCVLGVGMWMRMRVCV